MENKQENKEEYTMIELHEEELSHMLGRPPSWMLRWGTWLVLGLLLLFVAMAWFIKYPDIIEGICRINRSPNTSNVFTGVMITPAFKGLQVEKGQTVVLSFPEYPSMEFGMVTAIVDSVSTDFQQSANYVYVSLLEGLHTNLNRSIPFMEGMTAKVKILTAKRRFLNRIF